MIVWTVCSYSQCFNRIYSRKRFANDKGKKGKRKRHSSSLTPSKVLMNIRRKLELNKIKYLRPIKCTTNVCDISLCFSLFISNLHLRSYQIPFHVSNCFCSEKKGGKKRKYTLTKGQAQSLVINCFVFDFSFF